MSRVLVLCPYPENRAPSQRLKYEQYFPAMREHGYKITVRPFMNRPFWEVAYKPGKNLIKFFYFLQAYIARFFLLFTIARYDIVYVHLWVTPIGPPLFERMVRLLSKKMIYDIDDLVYLRNSGTGQWYINIFKGRAKPIYLIKQADHVITCTPYLDSFVRQFNKRTTDISSTINTDTYIPVNTYSDCDQITLGWSGSFSTVRYLKLLEPVFQRLSKHINYKLLVMGSTDFEVAGVNVEAIPWSEEAEIPFLQRLDLGLYPLPLDEEWVFGKSGLKALQYMALGIPTIATAIGTNFRIIENRVSGMLVRTQEQWYDAIIELAHNPALRKEIGSKARENVEANFSLAANRETYLQILDRLTGKVE